ncbi:ATP-binding protein [Streptomyces yaizuensis]|uniref:AAA family ATPase n=1 Tax=Streptomyces yaizuensis TaxID=2989713 RepID=A0ABQ5NZN1_9ACTN|nr:AAA family ATPase [Streptomyces sp. YSPA8]GLF95819.1 AAA family ATPase [Streptomyces sp. YSPA8]
MNPALIGRDHPAGVLRGEVDRVLASHGGLVLVTGEAGIGKSTLVTEAADEARRRGALVLGGSCWDSDSAPGYWPWVQVMRGLRRAVGDGEWAEAERAAGGRIGVLLGERPAPDGTTGDGVPADGAESFALYDAVTTALVTASQDRPVVVVLEDLHWSDPASLRLLEFAAQHAWFERLLLIGTYRDVEVETADHPLRPLVLALGARAGTALTLTGLAPDEVGALIALTGGVEPDPALVAEVHRRTGGNPFFVEQTVRIWRGGSPVSTVAPGVSEAVRRRLSLLPDEVGRLLETAAVLGREFHRQVLAAAVAAPVPHVERLIERAVAARLVTVGTCGGYAFVHDLVRETLYDTLDERRRRALHAAVVHALDGAAGSAALRERIVPADLARHAHLAGDDLERTRRVELLTAAGRDATGRLAGEEAEIHFRRAIEAAGEDHHRAALICLDLASTLWHITDAEGSWRAFEQALDLAREAGDPALLAQVAIRLHQYEHTALPEGRSAALLRDAYRTLISGGGADISGLSPQRMAKDLAEATTTLARDGGDDEGLAFSLWAQHDAIWGLGTAPERLELTTEMIEVARRTGNVQLKLHATSMRWVTMLELGDPRYREQLRGFVTEAGHAGQRQYELSVLIDSALVAAVQGRFGEAEELLGKVEHGEPREVPYGFVRGHLWWTLALLRGRFDEARAQVVRMEEAGHPFPVLSAALTAVESGDAAGARLLLRELPAELPRVFGPLRLRLRAQIAAATGDREAIDAVLAELTPHAGQWVVSMYGCDIGGPVDLWRGLLHAARGDLPAAVSALTAAAESADLLRARAWSVRARTELLTLPGGDPAALAAVREEAERLGMTLLPARPAVRPPVAECAPEHPSFRREGAVWSLVFDGRSVHMPDAKGLRDLHTLLSRPGDDLPAVALLSPEGGAAVLAARGLGGDPVLDEEAKSSYRRRLAHLDEELDRSASRGDDSRTADLSRERATLLDELRRAAGLGGRPRRLGDEAERARKTVTARIRDTFRKLDTLHPELAAHLREAVTTGAHCAYRPGEAVGWRL